MTEDQKIDALIEAVRTSKLQFIRNGSAHSSADAAEHLAMKRKRAGNRVRTAHDFIEGVASKSFLSGEVYMIRYPDGKEVTTEAWLQQKLKELHAR